MIILKIALRNVFRQKRRTMFTLLTIFGGFALSAVSIGWSDGSYSNIINMFTGNRLGHIQIHNKSFTEKRSLYFTIDDYKKVGQKILSAEGVQTWAPRLYSAGLVSAGNKSAGVQIIGIDPSLEDKATKFHKKIKSGSMFPANAQKKVIIGIDLANILNVAIGDEIVIVSQAADGSIADNIYSLFGIIESGDKITDRTGFFLHIQDAQEMLALENKAHEFIIMVNNINNVRIIADDIKQKVDDPALLVEPWQEFAKSFYQAMKADQQGMWIMLFIIILIMAIGVLNTVLMSVLERRREYGLLKAIGTKPSQIFSLVLFEVNILAVLSIIIGAGAATIVNYFLSIHGITLPTSFTYGGIVFDTLYSEINIRSYYIPTITVIIATTLISIFPALKAARIEPVKAMNIH
ncbi:MAG: FtsX-like permease family protein [bacterium]